MCRRDSAWKKSDVCDWDWIQYGSDVTICEESDNTDAISAIPEGMPRPHHVEVKRHSGPAPRRRRAHISIQTVLYWWGLIHHPRERISSLPGSGSPLTLEK